MAEKYLASEDVEERIEIAHDMEKLAFDEAPFVTLFFMDTVSAVNTEQYSGWKEAKGTYAFNVFSFLPEQNYMMERRLFQYEAAFFRRENET